MVRCTFENVGTFEGETTWWVFVNGQRVGELYREPQRTWAIYRYQKIDKRKPVLWTLAVGDRCIDLRDGLTAAQAKRAVREHFARLDR